MKKFLSVFLMLTIMFLSVPAFSLSESVATAAETLPTAVDLSTTIHLPPIGNQGAVGCCASMAASYMQFTNAYSRYIHEQDPTIEWNPSSGNAAYCFSPRFTYNLAGAGTAWVYDVLKTQGTVPQTYSAFSGGVQGAASNNNTANDWATRSNAWEIAQNYRIKNYDQVWLKDVDSNFNITNSVKGQELIQRIKQSLNDGNVVVTGGYIDTWTKAVTVISGTGTYGKTKDVAIPYSIGPLSGGHQVSIVGYDDKITCEINGVTLTGAFKVANSWGTDWMNDGFIWLMYDALNQTSSYSALNVKDRVWTMDQMVFLDYRTDLNIGTPEVTATVSLSLKDRDLFSISLTRTDIETGEIVTHTPYMFEHINWRPTYDLDNPNTTHVVRNFYNRSVKDYGWMTFNYDELTATMAAGKTVDDYLWGIDIVALNGSDAITVNTVKLNINGKTCYTAYPLTQIAGGTDKHYFLCDKLYVYYDAPSGAVIDIDQPGLLDENTEYAFSLSAKAGYRISEALTVLKDGTEIFPDEFGKYKFTVTQNTRIQITGIVPNSKNISASGYNGGEVYGGQFVYILHIDNDQVAPDVYDDSAISKGTYKYTFRCTVNGGEIYEFTPSSLYLFEKSTLYRLPVSDSGWFPKSGTKYTLKFEICYDGIPVYKVGNLTFDCQRSGTSSTVSSHTHDYSSGQYIYINKGNCVSNASGYEYCKVAGCKAIHATTLDASSTGHVYRGEPCVTKNATSSTQGEISYLCSNCKKMVFHEYFTASGNDMNGDRKVDISDVTLLLNYLAKVIPIEILAGGGDANGDGVINIKDMTTLLLIMSGTISG